MWCLLDTGITTTGFPLEVHRRDSRLLPRYFFHETYYETFAENLDPLHRSGGRSPFRSTRPACGSCTRINNLFVSLLHTVIYSTLYVRWKYKTIRVIGVMQSRCRKKTVQLMQLESFLRNKILRDISMQKNIVSEFIRRIWF